MHRALMIPGRNRQFTALREPRKECMNRCTRLWSSLLVALLVACTPARKEVEGPIARRIRFVGNGGLFSGHNDLQLRNQMEQDNTPLWVTVWPFLYWIDPEVLRPQILQRDAYRLEVWYAHNGFFDARILGWELREVRPETEDKAAVYDIWGHVLTGPPSLVRAYDVVGLPAALSVLETTLQAEAPLERGDRFNLDDVEDTRAILLRLLQNQSFAYASVRQRIRAYPDEQAVDVSFEVEPGITTVYGPVRISGNERIREEQIREVVPMEPGQPYKLDDLATTRQRLFSMATFSLVTVEPDLSDPTNREVPIDISVAETSFRRLRLGGGAEVDAGLIKPRAVAQFTHTNLLGELIRLDAQASFGAALVDALESHEQLEWVGSVGGTLRYPRFLGPRWDLEFAANYQRNIQSGLWLYQQPEVDLFVIWRPTDRITLRAGPHWEYYEFLTLNEETELAARRLFGTGTRFVNPYQLATLQQNITADFRDDRLSASRGWFASLFLEEAIPFSDNGFAYVKALAEGRLYRPVRFSRRARTYPFVFASRVRGGYIHPFQDEGVPYPELFFLGGPNSIRGFRPDQVGPYDTLCSYATNSVEQHHLPRGGTLTGDATAEARVPWRYNLTWTAFADAGILQRRPNPLDVGDIRWSVGVGGRLDTVIGPVRLDVSVRPLFREDRGPRSFVNCSHPDDEVGRTYDFFSTFQRNPAITENHPPFALVFYLAIGEAF